MAPQSLTAHVDQDLEDLIPGFLANRRHDIQKIMEALTAQDFEKIRILGHSMKGTGGGYGFNGISDIGFAIEDAAVNSNISKVETEIQHLSSYLDQVHIIYV